MRIDWVAARDAHGGGYCDGFADGMAIVDDNDDSVLECHESGEPVAKWCANCIGWAAVCELAAVQMFAAKEKPCDS